MTGYSLKFAKLVENANPELIGVQLGKICIKNDISVIQVSRMFNVSRTAVYAWFTGKSIMNESNYAHARFLIRKKKLEA